LEWLTTPVNYDKLKGGSSRFGATKKRLATEILLAIQEQVFKLDYIEASNKKHLID